MYVVMWKVNKRAWFHTVPTLEDAVAFANSIQASDYGVTVHVESGHRVYDTRRPSDDLVRPN